LSALQLVTGRRASFWVIAVLPEFEGRGVGLRLIDSVEGWLWSLGWQEIWLWTSPDRQKRAFTFYLKRDWIVSELKDGMLFMRKKGRTWHPSPRPRLSRLLRAGFAGRDAGGAPAVGAAHL